MNTYEELSKKAQARYDIIIKVATRHFLKNGYEKTSLNDIIKEAGGSLSTIYEFFGNKEGLFKKIIYESTQRIYFKLEDILKNYKDSDLDEFLYEFGMIYIQIHADKNAIYFSRILYAEGYKNNSAIAKFFLEHLDKTIYKILIDFLQQDRIKAKLKTDDFKKLTYQFCMLLREPELLNAVLLNKPMIQDYDMLKNKVKQTVSFFLHGYQA